jgi:MFS family permease
MASATPDTTATQDYSQSVRIFVLACSAHALSKFYALCLPVLLPLFHGNFGVSFTDLSAALATVGGTTTLLLIPAGFLADRFGARKVLAIGLFLVAASLSLLAVIPNFWWATPLMVAFGAGLATVTPCTYAILNASIHPGWVGRAFAVNMFTAPAGAAVAPLLMVTMAYLWSWRAALLAAGALGFLLAIALTNRWGFVRDERGWPKTSRELTLFQEIRGRIWGGLLVLFIFFIVDALTTRGVHSFTVAALAELRHTPLSAAGSAVTAYLVTGAAGLLLGGFIVDKFHRPAMIAMVTLVCSGTIFILIGALSLPPSAITVLMGVAGCLQGILQLIMYMVIRALIPQESFGKVIGIVWESELAVLHVRSEPGGLDPLPGDPEEVVPPARLAKLSLRC